MDGITHCEKPGCNKPTDVFGSRFCAACWYPGIDEDYTMYRAYRADGYGSYQAKLMVGWADPPDHEDEAPNAVVNGGTSVSTES